MWLSKKIFYPIYTKEQIEFIKSRAYIHLVKIEEPYLKGYEILKKT